MSKDTFDSGNFLYPIFENDNGVKTLLWIMLKVKIFFVDNDFLLLCEMRTGLEGLDI